MGVAPFARFELPTAELFALGASPKKLGGGRVIRIARSSYI